MYVPWLGTYVMGDVNAYAYIEGILPKGPYLPCVSMAGRALLARYPRYSLLQWKLRLTATTVELLCCPVGTSASATTTHAVSGQLLYITWLYLRNGVYKIYSVTPHNSNLNRSFVNNLSEYCIYSRFLGQNWKNITYWIDVLNILQISIFQKYHITTLKP